MFPLAAPWRRGATHSGPCEIARFLLIGHWYGTLVTIGVLIVLYLLHKLLLHYPLLDTLFPWCCDNWWCAGWRPEFMGKFKQCHLELDFSGRAPNMCITTQCLCWKWKRPKVHGRRTFSNAEAGAITRGAMNDDLHLRSAPFLIFGSS